MAEAWSNEGLMRKIYEDIRWIRDILLASVAESGFENFWTGIDKDCKPNPHAWCTSGSLYITMDRGYEGYYLSDLYTPFGKLQLLNGGYIPEMVAVSNIFLKKLKRKYSTSDVTNSQMVTLSFETRNLAHDFAKVKPDTILLRVDSTVVFEGREFDTSNVLFSWGRDWDEAKSSFEKASRGEDFC